MGFLDGLLEQVSNNINDNVMSTATTGVQKTGIPAVDNFLKEYTDKQNLPKPGKFCPAQCALVESGFCEACMKEQEGLEAKLLELEKIDKAIKAPAPVQAGTPRPTKCSLCGAPIESGLKKCPYCDTAYPEILETAELPESDYEREQLYVNKAVETHAAYAKFRQMMIEKAKEDVSSKMPQMFKGFLDMIYAGLNQGFGAMNAAQIRQGAEQHNVSYYEYILGVATEKYTSAQYDSTLQKAEAFQQEAAEQRRTAQEAADRSRQIEQERQAKLRQINQERNERLYQWQSSKGNTQYNGGASTSRVCGSCCFYYGDNECAKEKRPSNASDSCAYWKLR